MHPMYPMHHPPPHRARLAATLRRLREGVAERQVPDSLLISLTACMDRVRGRLEAYPRRLRHVGPPPAPATPGTAWGFDHAMRDYSPVSGAANPLSPPLQLRVDAGSVRGTVRLPPPLARADGAACAGHVAACFDEVLGAAMALTERPGMTGILEMQILEPLPAGQAVCMEGRIRRVRGPLVFADGTLQAGRREVARAQAIFFLIDTSVYHRLARERNRSVRASS